MRTFVRHSVMICAVTAMCQVGLASAEDLKWTLTGGQAPANEAVAVAKDQGCAGSCDLSGCSDGECDKAFGGCDCDPPMGVIGLFGFDSFKGVSDGQYVSNFGAVTGLNAAMPVPGLSDYGIGWQLGMTYGIYDFDGAVGGAPETQQQTFVTTGFYRKGRDCERLSFGLVYDWMLNNQWGTYGNAPTLGQWRGQVEYALSDVNGVGFYGCLRDRYATTTFANVGRVVDRGISQVNLFWHHKFECAADSWLWVGAPERSRESGDKTLGDWIIGASAQVPMSERLALYGNAEYMHPSAAAGAAATVDASWNVGAGIVWYFGGHAVSHSLNGKCWLPYMPVANNSTFLVDEATHTIN